MTTFFPLFSYSAGVGRNRFLEFLMSEFSAVRYEKLASGKRFSVRPIFWASQDDSSKSRRKIFFPFFWDIHRGDSYFKSVFPLLYDMVSGPNRVSIILPITYRRRTPESTFFTTLNYARYFGEGFSYRSVFPFVWGSNISRQEVFSGFMPLVWSWRSPQTTYDVVFPFYRYKSDASKKETSFLSPIFQMNVRPPAREISVHPFFYEWNVPGGRHTFYLFPFYWTSVGREGQEYRFVSPFFQVRREGSYFKTSVWPVYQNERMYAGGKYTFYLFPIFKRTEGNARTFLSPLWQSDTNASATRNGQLPFWSKSVYADGMKSWFILPVYYTYRQGQKDFYSFISPVWQSAQTPDFKKNSMLPIYSNKILKSNGQRHIYLFPTYTALNHRGVGTFSFISPIWQMKRDPSFFQSSILPVYRNKKRESGYRSGSRSVFMLPFYAYFEKGTGLKHFLIFPVSYYNKSGNSKSIVLLPGVVWHYYNKGNFKFNLYPIGAHYTRQLGGDSSFALLWKFAVVKRAGASKKVQLNPLFNYEKDQDGHYFTILGKLFSSERYKGNRTFRILHFLKFTV